jgi:hypothetical protein
MNAIEYCVNFMGCIYVIVDLIIFVFVFNMLSVYWIICNYYFTGWSRRYPQMSDRW